MVSPDSRQITESFQTQQVDDTAENIEPDEVDAEDVVQTADGELIHEPTGLVLEEDQIDHGPEWRAFTHSDRQEVSRVGAPISQNFHDKGLTTTIDWKNQDASGRSLSSQKQNQMRRLRKWQDRIRTQNTGERNLQLALSEIDRMTSALGIPDTVQQVAAVMYRRALNEDLIRGRSIEGVSTALLYAACRQEGIPRSLEEVAEVSRVDRKKIGRTYRHVANDLSLKMKPADPKQYVPRFASELGLSEQTRRKAKSVIDTTAEEGLLSGKSPTGFAAAAIYIASRLCNERRIQREIADVANVSEITVRNRYQEQMEVLDQNS
ncbi:transcription initiation factor TFIIB [Halohasta litchfieldiae]|jgi:transcription initiation factor TFIIB|uniref:Transcription initiation factor IIB n=1 Tax=Halohasta litchfieldiae TaxID=1073996 RepID=A0A1H6VZJ8_9EURY|nr:transcription initiation factor IIB [Halohasta litchfieldiae]ATW88172.1 transcription initiation factor TFIIB [Halohasta litchfieldiae]SEJ10053.1 transcription initiation factor TFIIB [Halohasta litchfieldiae]